MSFTPPTAGNADAANLSLFLELTSRACGYGRSWVTLPLSWVAEVCGAMHSCHVDGDVPFVVSLRHSLWVWTAHAAHSSDKPICVGLVRLDLEPDEQHIHQVFWGRDEGILYNAVHPISFDVSGLCFSLAH
jgi:hypothetical protein